MMECKSARDRNRQSNQLKKNSHGEDDDDDDAVAAVTIIKKF